MKDSGASVVSRVRSGRDAAAALLAALVFVWVLSSFFVGPARLPPRHMISVATSLERRRKLDGSPGASLAQPGKKNKGRHTIASLRPVATQAATAECGISFMVLGARKGGTTSWFHYLTAHPEISGPLPSAPGGNPEDPSYGEIHFWGGPAFSRGLTWYNSLFPPTGPGRINGEASVDSLVSADAPRRLQTACRGQDLRFFALLREPAERVHSNFLMRLRFHGWVKLSGGSKRPAAKVSFRSWVLHELEAYKSAERAQELSQLSVQGFGLFAPAENAVYESLYEAHLTRWLELFPREQFRVMFSEAAFHSPAASLRSAYAFLGVSDSCVDVDAVTSARYNTKAMNNRSGAVMLPQHEMSRATRELLKEFFLPYNRRLEALLGTRVPASWLPKNHSVG